ncbi:MAG: sucrose phosphorylase [Bacteroidota bacterium]
MKNQIQLITYVDRIGCRHIAELDRLLNQELQGLFGGVHLLPFFYPIDGEDAGFDPIDHQQVDPRLGDWKDIHQLSQHTAVMADLIVNHVSADSIAFQDFLAKGEQSEYADLFLCYDTIFPEGATEKDLLEIYRPRPGLPFTAVTLADGSRRMIWTTFTPKQVDIDVQAARGIRYLEAILDCYQKAGISMIRLDAAGYAIKKAGTSCFMLPETFAFIDSLTQKAHNSGIDVLVEIHSHYKTQIEIAQKVDYVYDFALPVLVLDTLFNCNATHLKQWLQQSPRNCVTVLDTHDGIGVVDVASDGAMPGLIPDPILDGIVQKIHQNSKGNSLKATGAAASNVDLYQVNCTYFEALGKDENAYVLARAIQFFVPGIPQVYYVGLFGDDNDMSLLQKTNVGRDINRHFYTPEEIAEKKKTILFARLKQLMLLRNTHSAFSGEFEILDSKPQELHLQWTKEGESLTLHADLTTHKFQIVGAANGTETTYIDN